MGNHQSDVPLATDLVDSSIVAEDYVFKVDNINSHGRKHSTAKILVTNTNLCIRQKHRQSLHIPLDTIKRYGLDGSIFILECGRRAPLGQARYAFRCKHARRLVECLDQRIHLASEQLFTQDQREMSSSTLTNVSSTFNDHPSQEPERRRQRAQSDHGRSPSPLSLSSSTSFYRNSELDLSENYFPFGTIAQQQRDQSIVSSVEEPMNYVQVNIESTETTQRTDEIPTPAVSTLPLTSSTTKSYVYIDHEKTNALKDVAQQRLQHHSRRVDV